jgi:hypothetical protein
MSDGTLRPAVRVVTLVVATVALTLSGGAPSWTDSLRPQPDGNRSQPQAPADAPNQ